MIENVRVVDKASRRVRLRAIPKIADRSLNSTPGSIAAHETYFGKPLREMAISTQINGVEFPGEVKPPKDGDITITRPVAKRCRFTLWFDRMRARKKSASASNWTPHWRANQ